MAGPEEVLNKWWLNERVNKHMDGQSTGTAEALHAHWMARPGAQKWYGKDGWGSYAQSQTRDEPGTLPDAVKVIDVRAGQGIRTRN